MTGQKVKKRGWVKDAAIIFLAIMLVLTFFSNTIMNHSLPEVAAQYVQSGAINAKIRGNGTVTANESFEVKSDQTREVLSVPVQVGDEVKVGDTLLLFSDAESSQIKELETALDALVLTYQKALIDAGGNDYLKENLAIKRAQEALDKAKAKRSDNSYDEASIASAQRALSDAKITENLRQAEVDTAQANLEALGELVHSTSGDYSAVNAASIALNKAKSDLDKTKLIHGSAYEELKQYAESNKPTKYTTAEYMYILANEYSAYKDDATKQTGYKQHLAYKAITESEEAVATAQQAYNSALSAYNNATTSGNEYEWNRLNKLLTEAKTKLTAAKNATTAAEKKLKELEEKKTAWEAADEAVYTNQITLEEKMDALATKQKESGKFALELEAQRKQISDKNAELAKLKAGGEGASVESKVNGKVASISVSAGKTTTPDTALMVIEVPDMGYGVSFSVTTEQSKKVTVGDPAEITNYYSQGELTATLVGIKSDPKNPGTNKILNFKLQGEVESGSQLSISIGERGGSYDTIVPTSSIRSDNNGKFVLVVIAKNSPLGNRYIAQRIDVKAIASDDVNTAVSGALTTSDMVITTSTKPIEPGTQVRLADN